MSAARRTPSTLWRRASHAARAHLQPRRASTRRGDPWAGEQVVWIAYVRRAQIAGRELGARDLAVLVHLAAGGRADEFAARTGWSNTQFDAEADRIRERLRARLELDAGPPPHAPGRASGGGR